MTKKIVVKVSMKDGKSRSKALKIAAGLSDLVSVSDEKKKESEPQMYYFSPPYNLQCYGQGQAVPSYGYVEHHEPPCSIL
ncbi:hypothetical protein GQ457_06G027700 [Hibiscus cannabinus]